MVICYRLYSYYIIHSQFQVANVDLVGVLLVIRVNPLGFSVSSLLRLSHFVVLGDRAEASLLGSISETLLASLVFELHCIHLLFVGLLLFHELSLLELHLLLQFNLILLCFSEALEVVRLDTMRREHGNLSLLVLRHHIVIIRIVDLVVLLTIPRIMLHNLALLLFLSKHLVDRISVFLVVSALISMVLLRLSELIVVVNGLLVKHLIDFLVHGLFIFLFLDLLLTPVLLL